MEHPQKDKDFIANNLHLSNKELADILSWSVRYIGTYRYKNRLLKPKKVRYIHWTEYETVVKAFLTADNNTIKNIAAITGKSVWDVDNIIKEYLDKTHA